MLMFNVILLFSNPLVGECDLMNKSSGIILDGGEKYETKIHICIPTLCNNKTCWCCVGGSKQCLATREECLATCH
ncbi:hypothetical protein ACET3Z_024043 [Daucus carota]